MIVFKILLIIVMVFPLMLLGRILLNNLLDVFAEYRGESRKGTKE